MRLRAIRVKAINLGKMTDDSALQWADWLDGQWPNGWTENDLLFNPGVVRFCRYDPPRIDSGPASYWKISGDDLISLDQIVTWS